MSDFPFSARETVFIVNPVAAAISRSVTRATVPGGIRATVSDSRLLGGDVGDGPWTFGIHDFDPDRLERLVAAGLREFLLELSRDFLRHGPTVFEEDPRRLRGDGLTQLLQDLELVGRHRPLLDPGVELVHRDAGRHLEGVQVAELVVLGATDATEAPRLRHGVGRHPLPGQFGIRPGALPLGHGGDVVEGLEAPRPGLPASDHAASHLVRAAGEFRVRDRRGREFDRRPAGLRARRVEPPEGVEKLLVDLALERGLHVGQPWNPVPLPERYPLVERLAAHRPEGGHARPLERRFRVRPLR